MAGRPLLATKRQTKVFIEAAREAQAGLTFDPKTGLFRFDPDVNTSDKKPLAVEVDEKELGYL